MRVGIWCANGPKEGEPVEYNELDMMLCMEMGSANFWAFPAIFCTVLVSHWGGRAQEMGEEGKQQEGRTHQEEEQVWKVT